MMSVVPCTRASDEEYKQLQTRYENENKKLKDIFLNVEELSSKWNQLTALTEVSDREFEEFKQKVKSTIAKMEMVKNQALLLIASLGEAEKVYAQQAIQEQYKTLPQLKSTQLTELDDELNRLQREYRQLMSYITRVKFYEQEILRAENPLQVSPSSEKSEVQAVNPSCN